MSNALDEEVAVLEWRHEFGIGLGLTEFDAIRVAASHADMHDLEKLLKAECPPALAVEIVL